MNHGGHSARLLGALFLIAVVPLRAQVITWTGGSGGDTSIGNPTNWSAPLAGDGTDDVFFGNSAQYFVDIPIGGGQLHNITLGDNEREDYHFGGTWPLSFNGDLAVITTGGNVFFNASLPIYLSPDTHTLDIIGGVTVTVNGNVRDAVDGGSIVKEGAGTLALNGTNSNFSGGVTVNAGTLMLGSSSFVDEEESGRINSGPVGTGPLTLGASTTLTTSGISDITIHNDISLPGSGSQVTFDLSNRHTFNNEDYFYDSLTLHGALSGGGAIDLYGDGNSHDGMHNGGNLLLHGENSGWSGGLTIHGDNSVYVYDDHALGTGVLAFGTNSASMVQFYSTNPTIGGLSGGFSADSEGEFIGSRVNVDTFTTLTVEQWGDTNFAGIITGQGRLVKSGGGTLTLSGEFSDFSGGLTVDAGTLRLGSSSTLVFDEEFGPIVVRGPVGTGKLQLENGTTLGLMDSSTYNLHNDIALAFFDDGGVTIDTGSGDLSLYGLISGSASLLKTGPGTLTLYGLNTFDHGLTVDAGTLRLGTSSTIQLDGESKPYIADGPVGTGILTLQDHSTLALANGVNVNLDNDIRLRGENSSANLNTGDDNLALNGRIMEEDGAVTLVKTGTGTLTLNNDQSSFTGGIALQEGTLLLGASSQIEGNEITGGPVGTGGLTLSNGTTLTLEVEQTRTLHNAITLDGAGDTAFVLVPVASTLTLAGNISGTAGMDKQGNGTLVLSGSNDFAGDLYVSGGTLTLADDNAAGLGVLEMGHTTIATVNFTTAAPLIHGLAADDAGDSVFLAHGSTLTIDQSENTVFAGHLDGAASIVKTGSGSLLFARDNDYNGTTTISGGKLIAGNANSFGTSTVVINGGALGIAPGISLANNITFGTSGGTLAGNYTFTTLQHFGSGITLSPGNSPGTMTFAAGYAPMDGVTTVFEFRAPTGTPGTDWDVVNVTGVLDLTSISTHGYQLQLVSLDLSDVAGQPVAGLSGPTSWTIFQATTLTGFTGSSQFALDSSMFASPGIFSVTQSGNSLVLNFTPVPEPSTYALLALGLGGIGLAAWRRRARV